MPPDGRPRGRYPPREAERGDLATLSKPLRQLRHLLVSDPLRVDVIALTDRVDVAPPEQAAAQRPGPGAPVDSEAIGSRTKARVVDEPGAFEHEVAQSCLP